MYDVVVVGARVAGASTALLLARKGLRILCVDRSAFPSDTVSSHQVQVPGAAALQRWGLLDRVIAASTPATRRVRFDFGVGVIAGGFPAVDGVDALYSPRRLVLDKLLIDAAREAGAEVRERFVVDEIMFADGEVCGIRGREPGGTASVAKARLIVGADGKHSLVARSVAAPRYDDRGVLSTACYAYWSGLAIDGGEIYTRPRRAIGVWPTNDGLAVTFIAAPIDEAAAFKSDTEAQCMKTFDMAGELGGRIRSAERVGPFRVTSDLPNFFRKPYGPSWALAGDAGLVMDPVSGQGISQAFADADALSDSVWKAFNGGRSLQSVLPEYERQRNGRARSIYNFTIDMASFHPMKPEERVFLNAIASNPGASERFFGLLAGIVPFEEYRSVRSLFAVLGIAGVGRAIAAKAGLRARSG